MSTLKEALENGGMTFAKMENNQLIFKLTEDLTVEEDFKVWDNQNKKFLQSNDELVATTGETITVAQSRGLRNEIFQQFFPNKGKKTQYIRNILVNGQPCRFGFGYKANEDLNNLIKNIRALGSDYLQSTFLLTKSGVGLETKFRLEVLPADKVAQMAQKPQMTLNLGNSGLNTQSLNLGTLGQESSDPSNQVESEYLITRIAGFLP